MGIIKLGGEAAPAAPAAAGTRSSAAAAAAPAASGGGAIDLVSSDEEEDEGSSSAAAAAPAAASAEEEGTAFDIELPDLDSALEAWEGGIASKARNVDASAARATAEAARKEAAATAAQAQKAAQSAVAAAKAAKEAAASGSSSSSSTAALPPLPPGPLHRRIDIRLIPHNCYATALLYFTGSGPFNERMRQFARAKGYSLSEYCIRPEVSSSGSGDVELGAPPVPVHSEKDVFDLIGMAYVPPESREV